MRISPNENSLRKYYTISHASVYLRIPESELELFLQDGDIPAGVWAKGWKGICIPETAGFTDWKSTLLEISPRDRRQKVRLSPENRDDLESIERWENQAGGFWYLDHSDLCDLLENPSIAGYRVRFLRPLNKDDLHAKNPEDWPKDDYIFCINKSQLKTSIIFAHNLLLLRSDLDAFANSSQQDNPLDTRLETTYLLIIRVLAKEANLPLAQQTKAAKALEALAEKHNERDWRKKPETIAKVLAAARDLIR